MANIATIASRHFFGISFFRPHFKISQVISQMRSDDEMGSLGLVLTCDYDRDVVGVDARGLIIDRPTDVDTGIGNLKIVYDEDTSLDLSIVGQ